MSTAPVHRPAPPDPEGVAGTLALFEYQGAGRDVVLGLKHGRNVPVLPGLADELARAVRAAGWVPAPQVVTWVPTTRVRRRRRGYDQSRLLAEAVARRLGCPCRRLLRRRGEAQEGLSAGARRTAPQLSARRVAGEAVLVVDDVLTTGSTLAAAAVALREGGAIEVFAATLAFRLPPLSGRG